MDRDKWDNPIPQGYTQPTRSKRLKNFVKNLESRIDQGGKNSSTACFEVPLLTGMLIRRVPCDTVWTVKRIHCKCWKRNFLSRILIILNWRRLLLCFIIGLVIFLIYPFRQILIEKIPFFTEQTQVQEVQQN